MVYFPERWICVSALRGKSFRRLVAQVGTSGIVPEEFPRRWESLLCFGLLRSAGDSPFYPCVCCLVHAAGVPIQVSISIIACTHWTPCKGGITLSLHCVSASTVPCKALDGGLRGSVG